MEGFPAERVFFDEKSVLLEESSCFWQTCMFGQNTSILLKTSFLDRFFLPLAALIGTLCFKQTETRTSTHSPPWQGSKRQVLKDVT